MKRKCEGTSSAISGKTNACSEPQRFTIILLYLAVSAWAGANSDFDDLPPNNLSGRGFKRKYRLNRTTIHSA